MQISNWKKRTNDRLGIYGLVLVGIYVQNYIKKNKETKISKPRKSLKCLNLYKNAKPK